MEIPKSIHSFGERPIHPDNNNKKHTPRTNVNKFSHLQKLRPRYFDISVVCDVYLILSAKEKENPKRAKKRRKTTT